MLPIPGPDRTATGRSIRDDLKNFNFTISGPTARQSWEARLAIGEADETRLHGEEAQKR